MRGVIDMPERESTPLEGSVEQGGLERTVRDGVTVGEWLGAMLDGSPDRVSRVAAPR